MAVVRMPDTGARSAEAVLAALRDEAEHKASLKMYFGAADLCHDYRGVFAAETKAQRERLAAEYEERGQNAEHERRLQGTAPVGPISRPHVPSDQPVTQWHCPACRAELPERLVVCGKCGFDMRTGKPFVAESQPWPELPRRRSSNTKVIHARHFTKRRAADNLLAIWVIGAIAVIALIIIFLELGKSHLTPNSPPGASRIRHLNY